MMLQGTLKGLHEKAKLSAHLSREIGRQNEISNFSKFEYQMLLKNTFTEYNALIMQMMGAMNALNPKIDLPF